MIDSTRCIGTDRFGRRGSHDGIAGPRRYVLAVFVVLPILVLAGCGSPGEATSAGAPISWDEYRQAATRTFDGKTFYLVEWDLPVTEEQLRQRYELYLRQKQGIDTSDDEKLLESSEALAIYNNPSGNADNWLPNEQRKLRYCVSNSFGSLKSRVVSEMAQAAAAWENEVNVDFTYVPAEDGLCGRDFANVEIEVQPSAILDGAASFLGRTGPGLWPTRGSSKPLLIDIPYFDTDPGWHNSAPNVNTLGVFRHELGHILGWVHEHTRWESGAVPPDGCFESWEGYQGLTPYDRESVMHYPYCRGGVMTSDQSITTRDALGAGRVYAKHRAPAVGSVVGRVRPDGMGTIYYNYLGHLKELAWVNSEWLVLGDLTDASLGVAAASFPSAFQRDDHDVVVAYRDFANHVQATTLHAGVWRTIDLTDLTGGPQATGNPVGYVRSDGYNIIVYRSATDNHIYELYNWGSDLRSWGISDISGNGPAAAGDPMPYVRSDRMNIVLYRDVYDHIRELGYIGWWANNDLTAAAVGAPNTTGNAMGYIRSDGLTTVVYRGTNQHIWELALMPWGAWIPGDLSANAGVGNAAGDPYPYVRSDRTNSIVWRGWDSHVWELALPKNGTRWQVWDLTTITGGALTNDNPTAYVRLDGRGGVLFPSASNRHIREMMFWKGTWIEYDLTFISGGWL